MSLNTKSVINQILVLLGIFSISAGVFAFTIQNWSNLPFIVQLLCTLGFGIAAYGAGLWLNNKQDCKYITTALFIIAWVGIKYGLATIWQQDWKVHSIGSLLGFTFDNHEVYNSGILLLLTLITWHISKRKIALVGAFLSGIAFYMNGMEYLYDHSEGIRQLWSRIGSSTLYTTYNALIVCVGVLVASYLLQRFAHISTYGLRLTASIATGITIHMLGDWKYHEWQYFPSLHHLA